MIQGFLKIADVYDSSPPVHVESISAVFPTERRHLNKDAHQEI
jgi:hypothetical protein